MRPSLHELMSFRDPANKRRVATFLAPLDGDYEVRITPRRPTRTNAQNRFWHGVVCRAFYDFLRAQDYDVTDPEQAHVLLKEKFLRVPVTCRETGEVLCYRTRSTTELSVEEFSDLIERSTAWLADQFNIVLPEPGEYGVPAGREAARQA